MTLSINGIAAEQKTAIEILNEKLQEINKLQKELTRQLDESRSRQIEMEQQRQLEMQNAKLSGQVEALQQQVKLNEQVQDLQQLVEELRQKSALHCEIIFKGEGNDLEHEYNTACPDGYSHLMNAHIYSMGHVQQWQSLCCQIYHEK